MTIATAMQETRSSFNRLPNLRIEAQEKYISAKGMCGGKPFELQIETLQ
jgi:hypothetical protein